jgi:hypothetical protein
MKQSGSVWKTIYFFVTILALILSVSAATYAWFTSNRIAATDQVSSRSGSDTVELLIASTQDGLTSGKNETDLAHVGTGSLENLQPVSTSDLSVFLYNPSTSYDEQLSGEYASTFRVAEDESRYYHGQLYLRASADDSHEGQRMALYLDQSTTSGGILAQASDGNLLKAARLGLTFDQTDPVIFRVSEESGNASDQVYNTMLNGSILSDGQVLTYQNGAVTSAADPAVSLSDYTITLDDDRTELPSQPLFYLELNRTYAVDVYFYLEGCDPDCSDAIWNNSSDLHLAFYGILDELGAGT